MWSSCGPQQHIHPQLGLGRTKRCSPALSTPSGRKTRLAGEAQPPAETPQKELTHHMLQEYCLRPLVCNRQDLTLEITAHQELLTESGNNRAKGRSTSAPASHLSQAAGHRSQPREGAEPPPLGPPNAWNTSNTVGQSGKLQQHNEH